MARRIKAKPGMKKTKTADGRERVRSHRARLRAAGLRPVQVWVPDTRSAAFEKEARRQSRAVARSGRAGQDQAFIDAVSDRDA